MRSSLPSGFDRWLTTDTAYEARAAFGEAFEAWAETEMPDLDWDDRDAVAEAEATFEQEMEDRQESAMLDAAEARAEARWEREMDRY